jgi:hypothetical protein
MTATRLAAALSDLIDASRETLAAHPARDEAILALAQYRQGSSQAGKRFAANTPVEAVNGILARHGINLPEPDYENGEF